jgi:hypothetical protein
MNERQKKVKKVLAENRLAKRKEERDRNEVNRIQKKFIAMQRGPLVTLKVNPLPGRNEKCLCGSLKKFKNCCLDKLRDTIQEDFIFDNTSLEEELATAIEKVGEVGKNV